MGFVNGVPVYIGGGREWDLKSMVCHYINRRRKRMGFNQWCVSVNRRRKRMGFNQWCVSVNRRRKRVGFNQWCVSI